MSQPSTFPCRIALEDFTISVQADANKQVSLVKARWEELQVSATYDGVMQKTRWLALPLANELRTAGGQQSVQQRESDDDSADSSLDIAEEDVKVAASGTFPTSQSQATGVEASLAKLKEHCVDLSFALLNNCSFVVWFNTEPQAATQAGVSDGEGAPLGPRRQRVKPKRVHFFRFEVSGSNVNRMGSMTGGIRGDKKPTSSNKEALTAAASKTGAKMSAWAKNTFLKLSSRSAASEASKKKAEDSAAREQALAAFAKQTEDEQPGKLLESGTYTTVVSGVDPSEAFNAPGGRKRFQLMLKPDSSKLPVRGTGVPIFLSFTMIAKYTEEQPVAVPRNFHRFVVVMDQVVLDLTNAAAVMEMPGRADGKNDKETARPRRVVGYGFGLTSNAVVRGGQPTIRSVILDETEIQSAEGSKTRAITFNTHHRTTNERELTGEDYKRLPTSVCVLSASCTEGNRERVGIRRVTVSRFKTSPTDGLCKPSYKCQLLLFLRRRLETGEVIEEPASQAIDLAGILNEEYYPPHLRQVRFSLGELMYVRLCRYCFIDAPHHRAQLLMPYDFSNEGVEITTPSNEPVAGWIYEANAGNVPGAEKPATSAGASASHQERQQPTQPEQQLRTDTQAQQPQQERLPQAPPQPKSQPVLETMEDRMKALNDSQPTPEPDSPPTPPLEADNPFVTQASTVYAPEGHGHNTAGSGNPFASDGANVFGGFGAGPTEPQGYAFGARWESEEPRTAMVGGATVAAGADDDFFADYGTGTTAGNAPAIEITPEGGSDGLFFTFGNTDNGATDDGQMFGRNASDARSPVVPSGYVFGESNPSGFEITPLPGAPEYSFGK